MSRLTDEQIRKLLCLALDNEILILTVKDNTATEMRESITDWLYAHNRGAILPRTQPHRGVLYFKGSFETIRIMTVDHWNTHAGCALYVFKGLVFVTNRSITDIRQIKEPPRPVTEIWLKT